MLLTHVSLADVPDKVPVRVRTLRPSDAPLLMDLFQHMSANSRYQRFNEDLTQVDPELVRQEAERMAAVAPEAGEAWLALADLPGQPELPIGGARYMITAPGIAEIAIALRDDFQHAGIGSAFLDYVAKQARAKGIKTLVATFQANNKAIWSLLRRTTYPYRTAVRGPEASVEIQLNQRKRRPPATLVGRSHGVD